MEEILVSRQEAAKAMKRPGLENSSLEELHNLALQKCGPRFRKRVEGFRRGYRHFLLSVVRRAEGKT